MVYTIGHSTLPLDAFIARLEAHGVQALADVRRFPASRRHPHFNRDALEAALGRESIAYHWLPALGGRRAPRRDSRNSGWRNASFRGYADYMETPPFREGIGRLLDIARERPTAIMCAESLWWRCHRALIADYLTAVGVAVVHIVDEARSEPHRLTGPARIVNGVLTYAEERLI
ncbi:MAG TPA: DUF488 domain-containing protein [Burkholderiales bacterium]